MATKRGQELGSQCTRLRNDLRLSLLAGLAGWQVQTRFSCLAKLSSNHRHPFIKPGHHAGESGTAFSRETERERTRERQT